MRVPLPQGHWSLAFYHRNSFTSPCERPCIPSPPTPAALELECMPRTCCCPPAMAEEAMLALPVAAGCGAAGAADPGAGTSMSGSRAPIITLATASSAVRSAFTSNSFLWPGCVPAHAMSGWHGGPTRAEHYGNLHSEYSMRGCPCPLYSLR